MSDKDELDRLTERFSMPGPGEEEFFRQRRQLGLGVGLDEQGEIVKQIKINPALIAIRRVDDLSAEVSYAGVVLIPTIGLSGGLWSDQEVEELRPRVIGLIEDQIERMSAHKRMDILAAVREALRS
ncbi:MAG: hypothetical protein FJX25_08080 [Alphaproteobacteria bacterium]|nr:hypothetical protein [Alphaproteobacteria bacterium]